LFSLLISVSAFMPHKFELPPHYYYAIWSDEHCHKVTWFRCFHCICLKLIRSGMQFLLKCRSSQGDTEQYSARTACGKLTVWRLAWRKLWTGWWSPGNAATC
jgi:hypothetical protein